MDPWKISTAAFGTLSAVLGVTLAVVWAMPVEPQIVEVPVAIEQTAPTERTEVVLPEDEVALRPLQTPSGEASSVAPSRAGPAAPAWVSDEDAPLPDDVLDRAREQLMQERGERRRDARDLVRDEIDAFLDDEGVDTATTEQVHALLHAHTARMDELRGRVRSGELDRMEARQQFQTGREELRGAMEEALGPDLTARLRERMPGPGGARPGVGGRGL